MFGYSSNKAFEWQEVLKGINPVHARLFDTINTFYVPCPAAATRCLPWMQDGIVEIPVVVPDDLQLLDGLGYTQAEMLNAWLDLLRATYQRGEICNLMFHPELANFCEMPLVGLLDQAATLKPAVWVAPLHEINTWWREKAALHVRIIDDGALLNITVAPPQRATLLVRGIETGEAEPWDGVYRWARQGTLRLPAQPRPLLGLDPGAPAATVQFLVNLGYLLDVSDTAPQCAVYLSQSTLAQFENEAALVEHIEGAPGPLARLWPWPNGMRSALCITGDLDALTLVDYASRLFNR